MNNLQDILSKKQSTLSTLSTERKRAYISTPHQARAWEIIKKLGVEKEKKKVGLVFHLVKTYPAQSERAWSWLSDYPNARDRFALFMWKIKDLRIQAETK